MYPKLQMTSTIYKWPIGYSAQGPKDLTACAITSSGWQLAIKALLHCAILSATCLAIPLRDKLPEKIGCLAIFLLREALHDAELSFTFRNVLQQLATPLNSVSPLQQRFSQFYGRFNRGAYIRTLLVFRSEEYVEKTAQRLNSAFTSTRFWRKEKQF